MNAGKILLIGREKILKVLGPFLKTPEEIELIKAQADKERSEASKNRSETFTRTLKEIAETRSLELKNLSLAIKLYEKMGYSKEETSKLVGSQVQKLLQTHDDLMVVKQLIDQGVIRDIQVRQLESHSKTS